MQKLMIRNYLPRAWYKHLRLHNRIILAVLLHNYFINEMLASRFTCLEIKSTSYMPMSLERPRGKRCHCTSERQESLCRGLIAGVCSLILLLS